MSVVALLDKLLLLIMHLPLAACAYLSSLFLSSNKASTIMLNIPETYLLQSYAALPSAIFVSLYLWLLNIGTVFAPFRILRSVGSVPFVKELEIVGSYPVAVG